MSIKIKQEPIKLPLGKAFGPKSQVKASTADMTVMPEDKVPLPPKNAKVYPTACDYCIVGCAYKAYVWPLGRKGGPKKGENAIGVDFPRKPGSGWWPSPNQHNIVNVDGKPHHVMVLPDGDAKTVNKGGNHSIRGGNIAQKCYSPNKPTADRLKSPLIRVGDTLVPISWDDATSIVAEVGRYVIDKYGEHAWGAKTHSYQFFENTYAETKLILGSVETPVWAHHDKNSAQGDATGLSDTGIENFGPSYEDWQNAEVLFIVGTDPYETKTVLYTSWIMEGNAKVISMLPRKSLGITNNLKNGGMHLQNFPGSDTPVCNAIARYILEKGWEDKEFISKWIADDEEINWGSGRGTRNTPWQWRTTRWGKSFKGYKKWLLKDEYSTLDFAAKVSGVSKAEMIKTAKMLTNQGKSPRPKASFMLEKGCYWSNNYTNTLSFVNLALICGAGTRPGQVIGRGGGHQRGKAGNGGPYPRNKSPQRFGKIGRLALDVDRWVMDGNVRFMYVIGNQWFNNMTSSHYLANYVAGHTTGSSHQITSTNRKKAIKVLKARADAGDMMLVTQDIYPRDIMQLADIVLPAATWGEEDFTRAQGERRVRIYSKFYDAPGDAKPDWWIIGQVGKKMGYPGFEWKNSQELFIEGARFSRNKTLDYAALIQYAKMNKAQPYDLLRKRASEGYQLPLWLRDGKLIETKRFHDETNKYIGTPQGISTSHKGLTNFKKASGKAIVHIPDWRLFKDFYDRITPDASKGELWVTSGRVNEIWQSVFDDQRKPYIMQRYPMNFLEIHSADAKSREIESGDHVLVENDDVLVQTKGFYFETHEDALFTGQMKAGNIKQTKGSFEAMAIVTDAIKKGVTFAYFLWPGSPANSVAHAVPDPITNAPRYKLGKGKIKKIGETPYKNTVTFAPKYI